MPWSALVYKHVQIAQLRVAWKLQQELTMRSSLSDGPTIQ